MSFSAVSHVLLPFLLCLGLANTNLFDEVLVDVSYDHYAERKVDSLPAFLAMPFNCLINVGYIFLGMYWLFRPLKDNRAAAYAKDVFALMALAYGPVQWVRLATLRRAPSLLDQWVTLPIFAWVLVWVNVAETGWSSRYALTVETCSILSYGLALVHAQGFDLALGLHIAAAVFRGVRAQRRFGDGASLRSLWLALFSCCGFVLLKLLDHSLAEFWPFQTLTGHFWSKVCDILQFHYSFCFLTRLSENQLTALKDLK